MILYDNLSTEESVTISTDKNKPYIINMEQAKKEFEKVIQEEIWEIQLR